MQNVSSRKLCAVPLDLFYSNDVVRHTAKSNLLNEIEITRYSLSSLMGNPDLLITATSKDFQMQLMKFPQSSSQALLNVKCWLQFLIDMILNFQWKVMKEYAGQQTHIQDFEIIDNRKVPKSFQSYLGNSNNKTNLVKYVFQKWRNMALRINLLSNHLFGKS